MDLNELKDILVERGYEDSVVFENPDYASAAIGVSEEGNVIYSYDKWWNILCIMTGWARKRLWNL